MIYLRNVCIIQHEDICCKFENYNLIKPPACWWNRTHHKTLIYGELYWCSKQILMNDDNFHTKHSIFHKDMTLMNYIYHMLLGWYIKGIQLFINSILHLSIYGCTSNVCIHPYRTLCNWYELLLLREGKSIIHIFF